MANTYLTISMITYEMLMVLHNNVVAGKKVNRKYEKQFAKTGAKVGNQIQVRKPPRYTVVDGATFVPQDYADEQVPLVVDKHKQVGCEFANDDLTLSMDDFSGRFLAPALVPMANKVDTDIMAPYYQVYNATGTPGTIASTDTPFLDARDVKLFNTAAMITDDMPMLVTGRVSGRLSSGLAGRFNPQKQISDLYMKGAMAGLMKGVVGHALGWDFFEDQNMPVHTTGAWGLHDAVTPTYASVTSVAADGGSVVTGGWSYGVNGLGKLGDVVQFAGCYGVNPVTYANTGELQDFVLTADVNSDGGGAATLYISPSIITAGKGQTVTAAPAAGATVTVFSQANPASIASKVSPQCMGWDAEAITLACVDLMIPDEGEGVKAVRVSDEDLGLSMVFMRSFDPRQYSRVSRIDILYGVGYLRPEHVVRVCS